MKLRQLTALLASIVLAFGVASAATLGTFPDLVASGVALDVNPCEAASVELQDSLGLAVDLVLGGTTAQVELAGLTGDCDGMVPTVIVIGFPFLSVDEQVLVVQGLPPITPVSGTATPPVGVGTDLESVADGLNLITEVRVTFSPN